MQLTPELEKLTRDNFNWFRMRWVSLIIHAVILCFIALPIALYLYKIPSNTALLLGVILGFLVTRQLMTWQYETKIKNALKSQEK